MNYPDDIAELESLLDRVLGMVEQDEGAVSASERPNVDLLFLASTKETSVRPAEETETCQGR